MADWFDTTAEAQGISYTGGSPTFDESAPSLGAPGAPGAKLNPAVRQAQLQTLDGAAPPQAGQFAATNQGMLDWATQKYGVDPKRGGGFVDLNAHGGLQQVAAEYAAATGNRADFEAGPSGDRMNFGQGTQDAMTSEGQLWNASANAGAARPATGNGSPASGWGGGAAGAGAGAAPIPTGPIPTAPAVVGLDAPAPFVAQGAQLGTFQGPAAAAAPGQVSYTNATAPTALTAQQVGAPEKLSYTPGATPTAFAGDRQATPTSLKYDALATPDAYGHENFTATTAADLANDPGYQFRQKAQQEALENSAAARGMVRGGNQAKALMTASGELASQEFANVDARRRATNTSNNAGQLGAYQTNAQTGLQYNQNANQNALQFGQTNLTNAERANADNYGRSSAEAQQGFANANTVAQQNNQGAMAAASGNNAAQLAATQANNQSALAYGGQNFAQQNAVEQQNNQGNAAAISTNNAANQAAQAQAYGQASNTFNTNAAANQQNYAQQLGAYQTNAGNALAYNQNTNTSNLNAYGAQTNAALGFGNLALGQQNSANSYALGQGNLGIQQGQLGMQQAGQQFNQDLATFNSQYQTGVVDPWNRDYQMAQLGQPARPD